MAGKDERHARSRWEDWGPLPQRSAAVRQAVTAEVAPAKRAAGRKDTHAWCKGKPGRAHAPELALAHDTQFFRWSVCEWRSRFDVAARGFLAQWECGHREVCAHCGKILRATLTPEECPVYPGTVTQRAEAEAAAIRSQERRASRPRQSVIAGPQGYRRPRTDA